MTTSEKKSANISPEVAAIVRQQVHSQIAFHPNIFEHEEPREVFKAVNIVAASNGLFEIKPRGSLLFVKKISNYIIPSPPDKALREGIKFTLPKIPFEVIQQVIVFFQQVSKTYDTEALAQIFYDHTNKTYVVGVPPQRVSGATVNWDNTPEYQAKFAPPRYELFLELHSHNEMTCSFSGRDDKDEEKGGFFGVITDIRKSPQIEIRASLDGHFISVDTDKLIEMPGSQMVIPADWLANVKLSTPQIDYPKGVGEIADCPLGPPRFNMSLVEEIFATNSLLQHALSKMPI